MTKRSLLPTNTGIVGMYLCDVVLISVWQEGLSLIKLTCQYLDVLCLAWCSEKFVNIVGKEWHLPYTLYWHMCDFEQCLCRYLVRILSSHYNIGKGNGLKFWNFAMQSQCGIEWQQYSYYYRGYLLKLVSWYCLYPIWLPS